MPRTLYDGQFVIVAGVGTGSIPHGSFALTIVRPGEDASDYAPEDLHVYLVTPMGVESDMPASYLVPVCQVGDPNESTQADDDYESLKSLFWRPPQRLEHFKRKTT
jgi:hypothetical protein